MNLTEIPADHRDTIFRLCKDGEVVQSELTASDANFWHAATGICTEAAEILEAVMGAHLLRAYDMAPFGGHHRADPDESSVYKTGDRYESPWDGIDELPGINIENIKEEMADHLFYEGALRIFADNIEHLPEDAPVSEGLWRANVGPLSLANREDGGRKRVLIDLAVIHTVLAGRILDVAKRLVIYRKGFDEELKDGTTLRGRLTQHLVDDAWVIEQMAGIIGCSEEELRAANIEKLDTGKNARYKDGYSDKAANAREDKEGHLDGQEVGV